ncbi:DUF192 domain-containing protein [Alteromonas sp. a30]|uniref:DUF192 domain-containing protein n=1 Tax=Alteromonas sp. a30 TaxID=2730917 RepID=UPI002282E384|nr:DUF192 domain-containing protein [Alteromonas sp. a30]MCY7296452.1 DUF192 domain-containing protein [Alteromonas sp. a30]
MNMFKLASLGLTALLAMNTGIQAQPETHNPTFNVLINGNAYQVCAARTQAEQALGIKNPHCKDGAMFYFNEKQRYIFNMVNVRYPLMLLTLDVNWKAQEVIKMAPEQPRIVPKKTFKFALELKDMNADVKVNDEVKYID